MATKPNRRITSVYLSDEQYDAIKERADALDISISAALRLIIMDWIKAQKKEG